MKEPNKIEEYFINIAEKQFPTKRHVSHLYKRLTTNIIQNTGDIKGKWELELNTIIEDDVWDDLCEGCHKGINNQLWKEFDWKVKIRYFNTPYVISKYVKEPSVALCWRKCGKIGDHTHIFWDCPKIQEFGKNIKKEIDKILEVEILLDPVVCVLGALPRKIYNEEKRYVLRILLLIAKKKL